MKFVKIAFVALVVSACLNLPAFAQSNKLIVGTKETAPFSYKDENGQWTGISVDLWQQIATELQLDFEWRELELTDMLAGVQDGSLDASMAAITITSEREQVMDFSYPYYATGLGIAVRSDNQAGLLTYVKRIFSIELLKVISLLMLVLLAVGFAVWLFERRRNAEQFGGSAMCGIASGLWWSAVTMTTVGYGDKAPATFGGRIIGLVWMFAGIIIISSFTAAITTELTVSQLESAIKGPEDLPSVRVATTTGSTSEAYLQEKLIRHRGFTTVDECLDMLSQGRVDAVVYDAPVLQYLANNNYNGDLRVLPNTFERQYYAIALPENSTLREPINRVLLEKISVQEWHDLLFRYLGQ